MPPPGEGGAGEFGLIERYFRPLAGPAGLSLLDDAALLTPPPGRQLVLTVDGMVEGVHYLPDDPADLVARKLLRVNLSDLAAKGAVPLGYLLTVSAPRGTPEAWFARFAAGLAFDQESYNFSLLGGDTTSTPGPFSLTATALGHVAEGAMVGRGGGRAGDEIWVTGTIGDGALGLRAIRGEIDDPDGVLAGRYRLPQPRLGLVAPGLVRAAMDVSDGLVQDLGHLCSAAGLGAVLEAARVPRSRMEPALLETCLTGGDDYELLMAVAPERAEALVARAAARDIAVTRVGWLQTGAGVEIIDAVGQPIAVTAAGWTHF